MYIYIYICVCVCVCKFILILFSINYPIENFGVPLGSSMAVYGIHGRTFKEAIGSG